MWERGKTAMTFNQIRSKPPREGISLEEKVDHISSFATFSLGIILTAVLLTLLYTNLAKQQNRQVAAWLGSFPKSVLPHLVESDYSPLYSKLVLMGRTNLFRSFEVANMQGQRISSFGVDDSLPFDMRDSFRIQDDIGNTWGFYRYEVDEFANIIPFVTATGFAILLLFSVLFFTQRIVRRKVSREFIDHQRQVMEARHAMEKAQALNLLAVQVAHDIRSPLAALNMVLDTLPGVSSEQHQLAEGAAQRIFEISSDLLSKYKFDQQRDEKENTVLTPADDHVINYKELKTIPLACILREIIEEKRAQYKMHNQLRFELDIPELSKNVNVNVLRKEFKRALSNILNNSVEALGDQGLIRVAVDEVVEREERVVIRIEDSGPGFDSSIASVVGSRPGISLGKSSDQKLGNGLGLFHARKTLELCGGTLLISQSQVLTGAQVILELPNGARRLPV